MSKKEPEELGQQLEEFVDRLRGHAVQKAKLYDGQNRSHKTLFVLGLAIEELGEIASAIMRNRTLLAREECLDLAHAAYLLYITLDRVRRENN